MTSKSQKPGNPNRRASHDVVADPAKTFDHPMQVIQAPELSPAQKAKALETWETDEKALQRASDEGMTGGAPPRLHEVRKAKLQLDQHRPRK
jgi:hypothetical protein